MSYEEVKRKEHALHLKEDRIKYIICHAEVNAILNKNAVNVKNCSLYVALFPCNECAKVIIQSGIKEIIYVSDKHGHKKPTIAAKRMFDAVGIKHRQYTPKNKKIVIDFSEIDGHDVNQIPSTPVENDEIDVKQDV
ncbi:hypothetical protein NQ314_001968 [Rhamnusium bicolor]|uniref:dCMP deaminase n=1 Tax=Rhamnusium bicolor TaxID=1586634 RepID=A0AAV8ZTG8_9CUCU|nr:hypothetical protein NQ314_001968 [Rhamnusium bicolor]